MRNASKRDVTRFLILFVDIKKSLQMIAVCRASHNTYGGLLNDTGQSGDYLISQYLWKSAALCGDIDIYCFIAKNTNNDRDNINETRWT